jgi:hypothetical protein
MMVDFAEKTSYLRLVSIHKKQDLNIPWQF